MLYLYTQEMNELLEDLKSFGLNPNDWRLVRETRKTYRIESDEDQGFAFRGLKQTKKFKNSWEKLEILSL